MGFVKASTWLVLFLVLPSASQPIDCGCPVTNKMLVVTGGGTCMIPGQGSVKCFDISEPMLPNGNPAPGLCLSGSECTTSSNCTFKKISVTVSIATCALDCVGGTNPFVKVKERRGDTSTALDPQQVGDTETYEIIPSPLGAPCGSDEKKVYLEFFSASNHGIVEIEFTFGCELCPALVE